MSLFKQMRKSLSVHLAFEDSNTPLIMVEALFAGLVLQLTNPFYQLFASAMGADKVAIGLISSLPSFFAMFVLLPSSLYIDRVKNKKKFLMTMISVCGLILPIVAMSPFLGNRGYWFFIIGISLLNAPYICYTVSWQSYFSDLFPPSKRAIPYARRQMVTNAVPVFTMLVGGIILSYLCKTQEAKLIAYQTFFVIAFICSIFQRKAIEKTQLPQTDTPAAEAEPQKPQKPMVKEFIGAVKNLKNHPQFCIFLVFLFMFYFGWQIAWPVFFIYLVTEGGYNEFQKNLLDVTSYLALTLLSTWWGHRIHKKGPRGSAVLGMFSSALFPAWLVSVKSYGAVLFAYLFSGATSPGFQLGLFNDMLENLPEENKSLYIGIYNLVMQISNFVAPLCGIALYSKIGSVNTMFIATGLRMLGTGAFTIRYFVLKNKKPQTTV